MSDTLTLAAEARDRVGKGASRALRRDGRVPAVIYGQNKQPDSIHLEEKALVKALGTGHFMNTVVMINGQRTLPKDVHFHPVSDRPVHVDFLRITAHATVTVAVPVVFRDEEDAPGLTKGGVLNIVRHELELTCDASDIPTEIAISLAGRDIGDTIHLSDITLPRGTESAVEDRDLTIATLIAPSAMKAEVQEQMAEEAAAAEEASAEAAEEAAADEADAATDEDGEPKAD